MSKRIEIVSSFYDDIDEDSRLNRSRHGQLEYATTMEYIHRYAKQGAKVLEIGAGTGRYSIALAKEGYKVTAIELVESNLEVQKKNSSDIKNVDSYQGDALNLSGFEDNQFDVAAFLDASSLAKASNLLLLFACVSESGALIMNGMLLSLNAVLVKVS